MITSLTQDIVVTNQLKHYRYLEGGQRTHNRYPWWQLAFVALTYTDVEAIDTCSDIRHFLRRTTGVTTFNFTHLLTKAIDGVSPSSNREYSNQLPLLCHDIGLKYGWDEA